MKSLSFFLLTTLTLFTGELAEDWQQWEVDLNPGRAGHSFSLLGPAG